jgi:hypothetical protein
MNIKNLFITTGISVLFGVYSIYNILEYLRILNNHRVKQINNLQHLVNETNTKYKNLQMKYHELSSNYEEINKEINLLNIKIAELQENKMKDTATNIDIYTNNSSYPENLTLNIICDELCNLNNEIPRVHMETMNSINDISYGYYSRTNNQSEGSFGWGVPSGINNEFWIRYGDSNKYGYLFDTGNDGGLVLDCKGFNAMSRTASNNKFIQLNSTINTFSSASSGSLLSRNFIFARGSQGYENRENAFGFIANGLTSTNLSNFYTAVQAFQTTLSRNV